MDKVNLPLERRYFETREQEEHYVAIARGFKDVDEFRAFRAAREHRNDPADLERRLTVLKLEVR
jgi:hypothetical protein